MSRDPNTDGLGLGSASTSTALAAVTVDEELKHTVVIGKRVMISGLLKSPEFNGQWGQVESYDSDMQRYNVWIDDAKRGQPVLAKLRRENLVVPPTVVLRPTASEETLQVAAPPSGQSSAVPPSMPAMSTDAPPEPAFVPFPAPLPAATGFLAPTGSGLVAARGAAWATCEARAAGGPNGPAAPPYEMGLASATCAPGPAADFEDSIGGMLLDELTRSPELPVTRSPPLPASRRDHPVCIGLSADFGDSMGLGAWLSGSPKHHREATPEDGAAALRPSASPKGACGTPVVSVTGSLLEVGEARPGSLLEVGEARPGGCALFPDHSPAVSADRGAGNLVVDDEPCLVREVGETRSCTEQSAVSAAFSRSLWRPTLRHHVETS